MTTSRALTSCIMMSIVALMWVSQAFAASPPDSLELRWRIIDMGKRSDGTDFTSAQLVLRNKGLHPISVDGAQLYFTCIAGIDVSQVSSTSSVERLTGTLFKLTPAKNFRELSVGQSVVFDIVHPEQLTRPDKAPQGPYLAFAKGDARLPIRIADYRVETELPGELRRTKETSADALFTRYSAIADVPIGELPPIFPTPTSMTYLAGTLRLGTRPRVLAEPRLAAEARRAQAIFEALPRPLSGASENVTVTVKLGKVSASSSAEAYRLKIDPAGQILVEASTRAGIAYGLDSLTQLAEASQTNGSSMEFRAVDIVDAPRFPFRGLLVDVARNFQEKESLFRLIDLMARFRLNKLHLHLTDDEGWRLAINGLPELTRTGGRRAHGDNVDEHLPAAHGSGPYIDDQHGSGHYSQADFVHILRYAAERHVEVIPEIEMPGHARAAVKAMEARSRKLQRSRLPGVNDYLLSDPDDRSKYVSAQLHSDNVMNPGMESTYRFIDHVVGELARLYRLAGVPMRTIHVGADELADGAWEQSPACQRYMSKHGLRQTADLWDHFYARVSGILRRHGAHASGWEELGTRKVTLRGKSKLIPNPKFALADFDLFVWNNLDQSGDLAYRLANAGYRVVLAPATVLYYDMAHLEDPREPGVDWAAITDLDKVFDFVPYDFLRRAATDPTTPAGFDGLTDYGRDRILGLEGTLFSEVMRDLADIEFLLLPRMLAMAERAWAPDPEWANASDAAHAKKVHSHAWSVFVNSLGKQVLPRLDRDFPGINYRIPPPGLMRVGSVVKVNQQLPGFTLRYATGGAMPTASSPVLIDQVETADEIAVAAFNRSGRFSRVSRLPRP